MSESACNQHIALTVPQGEAGRLHRCTTWGGGGVLENLQKIPKLFFPNFSFLRGNFKKMLGRIFPVFFFLSRGKTLQMFTASAD